MNKDQRSEYSMTVFNTVTGILCGMELIAVKDAAEHFIQTIQVSYLQVVNHNVIHFNENMKITLYVKYVIMVLTRLSPNRLCSIGCIWSKYFFPFT